MLRSLVGSEMCIRDSFSTVNLTFTTLGPILPVEIRNHCLENINNTHAILAGGYGQTGSVNKTYLLNKNEMAWTPLPPLVSTGNLTRFLFITLNWIKMSKGKGVL